MNLADLLLQPEEQSPLHILLEKEMQKILADSQLKLTGRQMQLLILIYEMDFSLSDVALIMQVGKTRAHQIHQRTLQVMKKELASKGIYSRSQI
jgi:DNA-directed RNA polymerase specialized sigma subunit